VAEIYSAISGNFRIAYTNGAGQLLVKHRDNTSTDVEAGKITVPPGPVILKVGPRFRMRRSQMSCGMGSW